MGKGYMKLWAKIGFIAFFVYYIDELIILIRDSSTTISAVITGFFLLLWFCLVLIPLAYYGFRKE